MDSCEGHSQSASHYDLTAANNATWMDAFQLGEADDTSWTLAGCTFELDVQRSRYDSVPLLSMKSVDGDIVIDDEDLRVIHFEVDAADIQASLPPGVYVYDLIMIDTLGRRVPLMYGTLEIIQGVTYPTVGL